MNKKLKDFVQKHETLLASIYNSIHMNSIRLRGNVLCRKGVFMKGNRFNIKGKGNTIIVKNGLTRLTNCSFFILGDNNTITIDSGCKLNNVSFHIEDSKGSIIIGKNTAITGKTHFAVLEGTKIRIGEKCLFSQNITFRTGDSHSIIDSNGYRINQSKDISIGNHVWIGNTVTILKGTVINDNCIIATGSILTGKEFPESCVVGGIGGAILKRGVNWTAKRIPVR